MSRILTAYFSASGVTRSAAKQIADKLSSDIFEIVPEVPYTDADLDWMDKKSRSTLEAKDGSSRPAVKSHVDNMEQYDTLLVGFPIWWYTAPKIIKTFLESYDLGGMKIILFATSGGSGLGKSASDLAESAKGAEVVNGMLCNSRSSIDEFAAKVEAGKF